VVPGDLRTHPGADPRSRVEVVVDGPGGAWSCRTIVVAGDYRVYDRHDEASSGCERSSTRGEHAVKVGDIVQRKPRSHQIHRIRVSWKVLDIDLIHPSGRAGQGPTSLLDHAVRAVDAEVATRSGGQQQPPECAVATAEIQNSQAGRVTHLGQNRGFLHDVVGVQSPVLAMRGVPVMDTGSVIERFALLAGHEASVSRRALSAATKGSGPFNGFWNDAGVSGDLDSIAARIAAIEGTGGRPLIAIDGIGASGKSAFAAQLASLVQGPPVVMLHVDDFFNPSAVRHARGRQSPDGFWLDAYNYQALINWALRPVKHTGAYCEGSLDHDLDRTFQPPSRQAPEQAVVLVEGTFLHRDELQKFWDFSLFLDVPFDIAAQRMTDRDALNGTHSAESLPRYIGAQQIYFRQARPWERASLVVDNADFNEPRVIAADQAGAAR